MPIGGRVAIYIWDARLQRAGLRKRRFAFRLQDEMSHAPVRRGNLSGF